MAENNYAHRFRASGDTSARTTAEELYEDTFKDATAKGMHQRAAHREALAAISKQSYNNGYAVARREIFSPVRNSMSRALRKLGEMMRP